MQKFRVRNIQLLVATDVAARGLDVNDLTHVINYGMPDEVESYTHRSGRTGRAGKTGICISICHIREKGKIREISKIINKSIEKGVLPSGDAICEKQLLNLVDQIEKVKVNEEEIQTLMPSIFRKLEWLNKEDLIKRLISLEFNRMLDYYREADEIEEVDEATARREARGERGGHKAEEGYKRFFFNFGKTDGLQPGQLMELVNKCVTGKVAIGRIDIRDNFSFFEVDKGQAQRVMDQMNGFELEGKRISVEPAQESGGGSGGRRRRSGNGGGGRSSSSSDRFSSGRKRSSGNDRDRGPRDENKSWRRSSSGSSPRDKGRRR